MSETKIAYQLDSSGYLVSGVQCDPDPEVPGNWLVPGGCIEVVPPSFGAGQRARFVAGNWVIDSAANETDEEPAPKTIEEWRERTSVTRFQARAALADAGYFLTINNYMKTLPEDNRTRMAWDDAQTFDRNSQTVADIAQQFSLTAAQVDALFIAASQIKG